MAGHRGFQLINVCARSERQHLVQGEELERIVVRPRALRRTSAFVPDQSEGGENALRVILSLHRAVGQAWLFFWLALGQLRHSRGVRTYEDRSYRLRKRRYRLEVRRRQGDQARRSAQGGGARWQ